MTVLVGSVFLISSLLLLNSKIQKKFQDFFYERPSFIFLVPWLLAMFACAVAAPQGMLRPDFRNLIHLIFIFTFAPTFLIYYKRRKWFGGEESSWLEFGVIFMLWLPIELSMWKGFDWLKIFFGQSAYILTYGMAVILGLMFFVCFKPLDGMKYNLLTGRGDIVKPVLGFIIAAAVLIPLGLWLGFLGQFRLPQDLSLGGVAVKFGAILFGIALPEEILFRSLIQNWLMRKFGASNRVLLVSALIFGSAHLNNGPGPLPNWRYFILATVAGFIYGKVFQKSSSVFSSAGLHAAVNTVRHTFFG
ncbi:MAG: CPBP family intramembrane metalloprotease [Candidatus Yanofskybacteria bacterium]|nr:CPBP family intramembrane metalloprotease [Candidatus Yanofskybacteria bacterium]